MARRPPCRLELGGLQVGTGPLHAKSAGPRLIDPGIDIERLGAGNLDGAADACERSGQRASDEQRKGISTQLEGVGGFNLARLDEIEAGLRLLLIGDGGGAHFKAALGQLQLLGNGGLLSPHG